MTNVRRTDDKNQIFIVCLYLTTFFRAVKSNELATAVKLSDLTNNMDLSRLKQITEVDKKRLEKYKKAYKYLKEQD